MAPRGAQVVREQGLLGALLQPRHVRDDCAGAALLRAGRRLEAAVGVRGADRRREAARLGDREGLHPRRQASAIVGELLTHARRGEPVRGAATAAAAAAARSCPADEVGDRPVQRRPHPPEIAVGRRLRGAAGIEASPHVAPALRDVAAAGRRLDSDAPSGDAPRPAQQVVLQGLQDVRWEELAARRQRQVPQGLCGKRSRLSHGRVPREHAGDEDAGGRDNGPAASVPARRGAAGAQAECDRPRRLRGLGGGLERAAEGALGRAVVEDQRDEDVPPGLEAAVPERDDQRVQRASLSEEPPPSAAAGGSLRASSRRQESARSACATSIASTMDPTAVLARACGLAKRCSALASMRDGPHSSGASSGPGLSPVQKETSSLGGTQKPGPPGRNRPSQGRRHRAWVE